MKNFYTLNSHAALIGVAVIVVALSSVVFLFSSRGARPRHQEATSPSVYQHGKAELDLNRGSEGRAPEKKINADEIDGAKKRLSELNQMWEDALRDDGSESQRVTKLIGIATSLAAEGRAVDAVEKVLKAYGPGETRCRMVINIFQAASDLESLEECFSKLEFEDEKDSASQGLGGRLSFEGPPDQINFRRFDYLGDRLEAVIAKTVSTYILQRSNLGDVEASDVFRRSMSVDMSPEAERSVVSDVAQVAPFSAWEHVAKRGLLALGADNKKIISHMINTDGQRAIEKISLEPDAADMLDAAFSQWMTKDSSKPVEWLQANSENLSEIQRSRAYLGIAKYAAEQGDLAVASEWAAMISEETVKDDLHEEIWYPQPSN